MKRLCDMVIVSKLAYGDVIVGNELAEGTSLFVEKDDDALLRRLEEECGKYDLELNGGRRMECWLVAGDAVTLWTLQTVGMPESVREKADVIATTPEDLAAKTVLVRMPGSKFSFPPLDRRPITADSNSTVHLVIAGFSAQAEALALNAALVAHYPNYCRDTRLRTRITIIDEGLLEKSKSFIQRYSRLFENSYYRTLNLSDTKPECVLYRPMYEGRRKDFVDVEWEFVDEDIRNSAVRQKFAEWSVSPGQQLTIALCHDDQRRNVEEALSLPDEVYENDVAVLCGTDEPILLKYAGSDRRYSKVMPFGRGICSLDTLRILKRLAKLVNHVYCHAFSLGPDDVVSGPASVDEAMADGQWNGVFSLPEVYSNVFNAMTLGTKMHSMGHDADDWKDYYALSKEEIEVLMEVEHNRWSVEELILGYRPVTEDEQRLIEEDLAKDSSECRNLKREYRDRKIHYDLRAFDDLRRDVTGKNVNVYDYVLIQSIPLIIKTCIAE